MLGPNSMFLHPASSSAFSSGFDSPLKNNWAVHSTCTCYKNGLCLSIFFTSGWASLTFEVPLELHSLGPALNQFLHSKYLKTADYKRVNRQTQELLKWIWEPPDFQLYLVEAILSAAEHHKAPLISISSCFLSPICTPWITKFAVILTKLKVNHYNCKLVAIPYT